MSSGLDVTRRHGAVVDWNDERGFGFISPADGGSRVFVHVSAFPRGRRPSRGCEVTYVEDRDVRGRARAAQVHYLAGDRGRGSGTAAALGVAALFFALLLGLVAFADLPMLALAAYGVLSVLAYVVYAGDKSAAQHGRWRTSEKTLHTFGLLGGWPGALVARHALRHKTTKQPFRTVFWVTVVVNCLALAWFVFTAPTPPF